MSIGTLGQVGVYTTSLLNICSKHWTLVFPLILSHVILSRVLQPAPGLGNHPSIEGGGGDGGDIIALSSASENPPADEKEVEDVQPERMGVGFTLQRQPSALQFDEKDDCLELVGVVGGVKS